MMPDSMEFDTKHEPAGAPATPPGATSAPRENTGDVDPSVYVPDLAPLLDVAEGRINFVMANYENAVHASMLASAAGLECGTIWTRGWREIFTLAANAAWRTGQTSFGVSSDLLDRWMDIQVRSMDAAAARLAKAA